MEAKWIKECKLDLLAIFLEGYIDEEVYMESADLFREGEDD